MGAENKDFLRKHHQGQFPSGPQQALWMDFQDQMSELKFFFNKMKCLKSWFHIWDLKTTMKFYLPH